MNVNTSLPTVTSFVELKQIAESAEAKLSFWGPRDVYVQGYDGILSIDDLAERTMKMLKLRKYAFSEEERAHGKILVGHINRIYREYDVQFSASDVFTKSISLFLQFISMITKCGDVRDQWEGDIKRGFYSGQMNVFSSYSRTQFQNSFGFPPEEAERRGYLPVERHLPVDIVSDEPLEWPAPRRRGD